MPLGFHLKDAAVWGQTADTAYYVVGHFAHRHPDPKRTTAHGEWNAANVLTGQDHEQQAATCPRNDLCTLGDPCRSPLTLQYGRSAFSDASYACNCFVTKMQANGYLDLHTFCPSSHSLR